jgi:hypothetical protein
MNRRTIAAGVATALAAGATSLAAAAAGPAPPVMQGPPGIQVAGGAHVVATARANGTTLVQLVRDRDGKVTRSRVIRG